MTPAGELTFPQLSARVAALIDDLLEPTSIEDATRNLLDGIHPTPGNLAMVFTGVCHAFAAAHPTRGMVTLRIGDDAPPAYVHAGRLITTCCNDDAQTHRALMIAAFREGDEYVSQVLGMLVRILAEGLATRPSPPDRRRRPAWWKNWGRR